VNEFTNPTTAGSPAPGEQHLLSSAGSNRYQYWNAAIHAFASKPIAGIGAGNYALYWNAHPEVELPVLNAHSLYLETLAELGVVGLALVVGFFAAAGVAGWRGRTGAAGREMVAALAVLAAGAFTAGLEWTWQLPAAFVPVAAAAGVLTAVGAEGRAIEPAPSGARLQSRFGLGIATIGIGWASIWAAGILFVAEAKLSSSREAASRGDLAQAANDADDAAGVEPWSPEPRLQLALVDELAGNLSAARSAAGEAIDRAPGDWRAWAVAARIDARSGDLRAAYPELVKANALNPVVLSEEFVAPIRHQARVARRKLNR
jgi:hypothetical protein